jgi:hypothetical protein
VHQAFKKVTLGYSYLKTLCKRVGLDSLELYITGLALTFKDDNLPVDPKINSTEVALKGSKHFHLLKLGLLDSQIAF